MSFTNRRRVVVCVGVVIVVVGAALVLSAAMESVSHLHPAAHSNSTAGPGRPAYDRVVIGVMTTAALAAERVSIAMKYWVDSSDVTVVFVSDSHNGLSSTGVLIPQNLTRDGLDRQDTSRIQAWVARDCASDNRAGLMCKVGRFFAAAPGAFPAARWFLRITDDSMVLTDYLVWAVEEQFGDDTDTPRTIGVRTSSTGTPDPNASLPRVYDEHPPGGGWLVSRGALLDPRFRDAWEAVSTRTENIFRQDDVTWGSLIAYLGWPRIEPSLSFHQMQPTLERCNPWYICASARILESWSTTSRLPQMTIQVYHLPVHFHMNKNSWDARYIEAGLRDTLAWLAPGGNRPLRFVLARDARAPPPLDSWYATSRQREMELCNATEMACDMDMKCFMEPWARR